MYCIEGINVFPLCIIWSLKKKYTTLPLTEKYKSNFFLLQCIISQYTHKPNRKVKMEEKSSSAKTFKKNVMMLWFYDFMIFKERHILKFFPNCVLLQRKNWIVGQFTVSADSYKEVTQDMYIENCLQIELFLAFFLSFIYKLK